MNIKQIGWTEWEVEEKGISFIVHSSLIGTGQLEDPNGSSQWTCTCPLWWHYQESFYNGEEMKVCKHILFVYNH